MPRTIANPITKGWGQKVYHRRLDNIEFDGELLSATIRSTTLKGKGKSLVLTEGDGWQLVEVDRYSLSLNVVTGEFSCDCPQGVLPRRPTCKHIERLLEYARAKGITK